MDSDGLPLVGPGIDYTKVEAIHQKRTIAFLNHFISHTARFLNHFSGVCEEKLSDLSVRIQRLEFTMSILETKLSSIPGLETVTAPTSSTPSSESSVSATTTTAGDSAQNPAAAAQPSETPQPVEEKKPEKTVAQDPRYAKFFKMLQVGVPAQAIKLKMIAEGLNENLLDTPDAPMPESSGPSKKDDSDDFSDGSDDTGDESSGFSD
ncbi:WASH complex subunit 3-like [Liolophura sinensis]|uniref:WASH complex subunit 3-like n=1 Tax=Liolophura sinensis TaxID=3198878 RepID=UPI0031597DAB